MFGRVGFVSVGFSAEKPNMVALLFCPRQRELPLVVTMTKSAICCWSGASLVYVTSLFTLVSVVSQTPIILTLHCSFQHWDFQTIKDRKEALSRHESSRRSSKSVQKALYRKTLLSRTDFAFCHVLPLRHSSCQTGGNDCCF